MCFRDLICSKVRSRLQQSRFDRKKSEGEAIPKSMEERQRFAPKKKPAAQTQGESPSKRQTSLLGHPRRYPLNTLENLRNHNIVLESSSDSNLGPKMQFNSRQI